MKRIKAEEYTKWDKFKTNDDELSPLEAFKRIKLCSIYDYDEIKEDTKIVETALKQLEAYNKASSIIDNLPQPKVIINEEGSFDIEGCKYLVFYFKYIICHINLLREYIITYLNIKKRKKRGARSHLFFP